MKQLLRFVMLYRGLVQPLTAVEFETSSMVLSCFVFQLLN